MSVRPVTVVTGGGRGIGAATAAFLARAGHDLVVDYRADAGAAAAVVEAVTAGGGRGVAMRWDVHEGEDVEALFAADAGLGAVTRLVNNAGPTAHLADLADTPGSGAPRG